MNSILKGTTSISNLLNPGRWPHPNIPMQQMLWILTLICMQFMGNYWLRHVCPDYTADFAQGLDKSIHTIFQMCIGIDINSWTDFAKERMQLLIRFKGLGLQASFNRCHTQYIGALTQSIPYLINQTDSNNTIQGRLNIQSIVNLLGEDWFDSTLQLPWEKLLNAEIPGTNDNIANRIRHAWTHLQNNYWLRHICPDYTADLAQGLDKSIHTIFQMCIRIDINSWTDFAKERMQLPIWFKGLGLQESFNRCHTQYIGTLTQSIPYLIDQTYSNNTIQGRLDIQSIVNLLGEDWLNSTSQLPWEKLLNAEIPGTNDNIANGLRHAWTHLQNNFQFVAMPTQLTVDGTKYLLTQDISRAGSYHDGSTPKSVTNTITMELEKARMTTLGDWIKELHPWGHYKHNAWQLQRITAVPFHSPPDNIGYQENSHFRMTTARYLGQPRPIIAPLVGRYFGNKGTKLNEHGANLASGPLPGRGHSALHNQLQHKV